MSNHRILVVEDEYIVGLDIENRLRVLGYHVAGTAAEGEEAVRLAGETHADLVLMDIRLQGPMDGITAAEAIRSQYDVPIVFLTAHADEATLLRARVTEAQGYVLKPFEERELRATIEMALYKHQAERKLRASERRYAATLASIGDAVIATDRGGHVTFMNPIAERLTGWPAAEAAGRPIEQVLHIRSEEPGQVRENPTRQVLRHGVASKLGGSTVLIARDGRELPIEDSAAPIHDDHGNCTGAVVVFRDVTEKRQLEGQLRQAQKMEAIGQLAGGVAHDFNNLLTIITGYGDILLGSINPEHPWHSFMTEIMKAGGRAADLTRQLLAFSRKQLLQPRVLDLNQVIAGMLELLRRLIGENIHISTKFDPEAWSVQADPGQVEQVLLNLAVNARDAMPRGGELRLATDNVVLDNASVRAFPEVQPGRYVCLTVTDTGCGMDEKVKARIFEPFFTTKEVGKGTGLGLATVYGIVKQSDGHITVDSQVGQGATFRIYLPSAEVKFAHASNQNFALDLPRGTETVLLVDDEEGVRRLARQVLEACGYTVLEAADGQEAVAVSQQCPGPLHLLVSDLTMPVMGGQELAAAMTRQRPGIRVLFLSGYAEAKPTLDQHGTPLLQKPFTPLALAQAIRQALPANTTANSPMVAAEKAG